MGSRYGGTCLEDVRDENDNIGRTHEWKGGAGVFDVRPDTKGLKRSRLLQLQI
jgi:hypothetical protein